MSLKQALSLEFVGCSRWAARGKSRHYTNLLAQPTRSQPLGNAVFWSSSLQSQGLTTAMWINTNWSDKLIFVSYVTVHLKAGFRTWSARLSICYEAQVLNADLCAGPSTACTSFSRQKWPALSAPLHPCLCSLCCKTIKQICNKNQRNTVRANLSR